MATFKSTEKMKLARQVALAKLKAMTVDELIKAGEANKDSVVAEFLTAHRRGFYAEPSVNLVQEEFTVTSAPAEAVFKCGISYAAFELNKVFSWELSASHSNQYYCQAA